MKLLIEGGVVVDPGTGLEEARDVLISDDRIEAIAPPGSVKGEFDRLDASGLWVVPGLVDAHVHLREPGFEYKETVATGTLAAVAGGFTAVACMANTDPVNDNAAVTELILERARAAGRARVYPIGAVSLGLKGERLAEIGEMRRAGIVAVSDDGKPITDGNLMRRALEYCSSFRIAVIVHEEEPSLAAGGVMNEGPTSFRLGLRGMPAAAEDVMVARDIALVERTGGHLHVAHLSTAGAVDLVRRARARGLPVTAEAAPHHFTLTEEAVAEYDTNAKMKPPLRSEQDRLAVIEGIRDGTITVIATDHAPHHHDEKDVEFEAAADGIVGLETALPLSLRLVHDYGIPRTVVLRALTVGPASLLGVPGGSLRPGERADLTLIDPDRIWRLDPNQLHSKSKNTPFADWELRGRAVHTIVDGRLVWSLEGPPGTARDRRE